MLYSVECWGNYRMKIQQLLYVKMNKPFYPQHFINSKKATYLVQP